ncbi:MAG: AIR synthase family protein [Candidatus Bipolaricaulota bacterium]|nr:AIR synthase family protein [Candidatus Bipolaricaulota bacterium]MBS3791175.1 AIR synthase family protein [Candidatus Bipolaricaulota bacterium]
MVGKVGPDGLNQYVFNRLGSVDESVVVGPAYGEDTAAIDLGDRVLVVNSDPIIYAGDRVGTLGVNIASNDLAASGAEPRWMTITYLLPDGDEDYLDKISRQIDNSSQELGIAIIGGHSEYISGIKRPFLSLTCFGLADRYIPTGGVRPEDKLILTKGAGIEATGILATDFREELEGEVAEEDLDKGADRLTQLSVLPEGLLLNDYATAMHDPTEGGVLAGLFEMASASGLALEIEREEIVVNPDTEKICEAAEVDPLKVFGSGALIASVPAAEVQEALELLSNNGIRAAVIGEARASDAIGLKVDGETFDEPIGEQTYELWD